MITRNCDICFEPISKKEVIINLSGDNFYDRFDLCETCAKPVLKFLAKEKLWEDKELLEKQQV